MLHPTKMGAAIAAAICVLSTMNCSNQNAEETGYIGPSEIKVEDGKMTKSRSLISTCENPVILNSLDFIKAIRDTFDAL